MPKKSICIKVPKIHGEKTILLVRKLGFIDRNLEIQRNRNFLYIPLIHQPYESQLEILKEQVADFEVSTHTFPERKKHTKTFIELLDDQLSPHLLASIPRAMDIVGDIAIIEIPHELDPYKAIIGEAILKTHGNLRTVLAKAGAISGTYRTREFSIIAGEPKTETIHREHGCRFHVDLAQAYFSPRLSHEHKRIASLVKEGETIIDMFAGVGPFTIQIAKTHKNVKVYAVDINPYAIKSLKKNIRLNRVEDKVYPIQGDVKQLVKDKLSGIADRVIMNLPEKAIEFVGAACKAIKPAGGIVHFYGFVRAPQSLEDLKTRLIEETEKYGRKVKGIFFSRFVRATAPYEWQTVLDTEIH